LSETGFAVAEHCGQAVVTAPDEIDLRNAGSLREALVTAAASKPPVIIVDMSSTEFCDSTGLNVLVRAKKQADADGRHLRLVVRGAALRRILAVTGMDALFQIFDSLDQAFEAA
jgi:anti-sigma B factor antagonist